MSPCIDGDQREGRHDNHVIVEIVGLHEAHGGAPPRVHPGGQQHGLAPIFSKSDLALSKK